MAHPGLRAHPPTDHIPRATALTTSRTCGPTTSRPPSLFPFPILNLILILTPMRAFPPPPQAAERATRVSGHAVDDGLKWLQWPQYLDMVRELRSECAGGRGRAGVPRECQRGT